MNTLKTLEQNVVTKKTKIKRINLNNFARSFIITLPIKQKRNPQNEFLQIIERVFTQ